MQYAFDAELKCCCVSHMSGEKKLPHADPEASCQTKIMGCMTRHLGTL